MVVSQGRAGCLGRNGMTPEAQQLGNGWPLRVWVAGGQPDHRARRVTLDGRKFVRRVRLQMAFGRHRVGEQDQERALSRIGLRPVR
ncbi:hypothetical protein [Kitasatospora camelliae]|uniref:Uncharacterized protein n=1 Tax=Kitasatospora camelliae TaxID=3156397 RepID=A0AAU8K5U4_9ACTN